MSRILDFVVSALPKTKSGKYTKMNTKYKPTIGLEIHAELKTKTKMFCDSLNDPNEKHPNINICPVCTGQPGALPTINKKAVEAVLKVGMALSGDIPQSSKFDRKNYFYPDLPKGYQISQYDVPLIFGGMLNSVRLERIHLEEDTARLAHAKGDAGATVSLVDFNRAGVPLMELVSKPDITSADQVVEFAKELQHILRYTEVSDADMEKGQMRVEVNISLAPPGAPLGTKVEIKNIGSFRSAHEATQYEIKRQTELLDAGEKVVQETRGWDDSKNKTVSQRVKEEAKDYRYFPEPDLPPLDMSIFDLQAIKREIPELPKEKRVRIAKEYNLAPEHVEILVGDRDTAKYFEQAVSELAADDGSNKEEKTKLTFNYLTSDLRGLMINEGVPFSDLKITPEDFGDLITMVANKEVSSRTAKDLLARMFKDGVDPRQILQSEGLQQVSDEGKLQEIAEAIIAAHPKPVEDYKKGKENALQFLVGKAMGALKGSGNPEVLKGVFKKLLG